MKGEIIKDEYDICIIGTGPAGLTLCNELKDSNKKICIIESGLNKKNKEYSQLKKVISTGEIKIKDNSRERVLGGTSTTWAGLSAPMDEIDIQKWPLQYSELTQYYKLLNKYGFADYERFSLEDIRQLKDSADFKINSKNLSEKIFIAKDPAWNFAHKLSEVFTNKNIKQFVGETVIDFEIVNENDIDNITICNLNTKEKRKIRSKKFVICAGGIESTRLMLIIKDKYKNIDKNNIIGKFIMNHPKNNSGIIYLNKKIYNLTYLFGYLEKGWAKSAGIRISEERQKELGVLNSYVRFEPVFPWTDNQGITELIGLTKKFTSFLSFWKNSQKGVVNLRDWNETGDDMNTKNNLLKSIYQIIINIIPITYYIFHRLFKNIKLPIDKIRLRNFMEMEPRKDNYITLSNQKDVFGNKLPIVHLNLSELDKMSLVQLHNEIDEYFRQNNIGYLKSTLKDRFDINSDASHHIGGTIMGLDKNHSVVSNDLRVHDINNLYICSSSVFPTSGCANPTYTICALAIRLAKKLS